jgi:DNA-binding CsgD family transcriptional regulator
MVTSHFDPLQFSTLVGKIYDCVAEPEQWTDVLQGLTEEMEGVVATLAVLDLKTRTSRFGAAFGAAEIIEPLVTRYAAEMPFYHVVPKLPIDVPITMPQLCALHGPDGMDLLQASRLWTEWFMPHHITDAMCTNIIKSPDRVAALVINVSESRRSIDQNDIDKLSLITPHIRRAVTIGDLFDLQKRNANMFQSTLDGLQTGVLIVGEDLDLLYANQTAEQFLADHSPVISAHGNRVSLINPHSQKALTNAVAIGLRNEAALGARGIGLPLPGPTPCVAHVLPLANRSMTGHLRKEAAAAIFICKAGDSPQPHMDAIAALFGLTAAEQRVALQVASGLNRQTIASANHVSAGTVKSQLEAIFDKTGTSSQRELEKLLRDLSPPIHHD